MSRDTALLLLSWLLANIAFALLFFVPVYLGEAKSFGTIFPVGWDPPGYAGYAKIILSGDLLRPIVDQNSLGLANFAVAFLSLVTGTSPAVATIIFIHATLAATSFLLAYLSKQYLSETLAIVAAPWLVLFSGMALRLYTIPDQSLSIALVSSFLVLLVLQAGKEKVGTRWYVLSSLILVALFAAHWYYDLVALAIAMAVTLVLSAPGSRRRMLGVLLPPFVVACLFSLATISFTLQKVFTEWNVSNVPSPYTKLPTITTATGYVDNYIFDTSVLVAVLFIAGILELFFWSKPTTDPRASTFRSIARGFTITSVLVMGIGLALSNSAIIERGALSGLLILPVLIGAEWVGRAVVRVAGGLRLPATKFVAAVLFFLVLGSVFATSVPFLQSYRQSVDTIYVSPDQFRLMQQGAAMLSASHYEGTPTVLFYNPTPSYYDVFEFMKVTMMVMGDVSFQYGVLPNSTWDATQSAYEQSLSAYLNYIAYQDFARAGRTAGPLVVISGLYNDPTNSLALARLNASAWAPFPLSNSTWSLEILPHGGGTTSTLNSSDSGQCGGMPIQLDTTSSNASQRVAAFSEFPNASLSGVSFIRFTFTGSDSGITWQLRLSTDRWKNFYYVTFVDDFTGQEQMVFAQSSFAPHGSPSWSQMGMVEFIGQAHEGEWQFGCLETASNVSAPEVVILPGAA